MPENISGLFLAIVNENEMERSFAAMWIVIALVTVVAAVDVVVVVVVVVV